MFSTKIDKMNEVGNYFCSLKKSSIVLKAPRLDEATLIEYSYFYGEFLKKCVFYNQPSSNNSNISKISNKIRVKNKYFISEN